MATRIDAPKSNVIPKSTPVNGTPKATPPASTTKRPVDEFSVKRQAHLPQPPPPARLPSSVKADNHTQYVMNFNPPITDQKAASLAIFGSDKVPEGLSLDRAADGGWRLSVTPPFVGLDEAWSRCQANLRPEIQNYLVKNLPGSYGVAAPEQTTPPEPGPKSTKADVKVTAWTTEMVDVATMSGTKMVDATTTDVDFGKPMTREQAAQYFWDSDKVPMGSKLEPMPPGATSTSTWRVVQPDQSDGNLAGKMMDLGVSDRLINQMTQKNRRIPEWIGPNTAAAARTGAMPPKGVEVKHPKPGISVWREGKGVFWYDEKSKNFQAFPRQSGNSEGVNMWNNWNTSYIVEQGLSPRESGKRVIADMDGANKTMAMAFAQALASGRAPEEGVVGAINAGADVLVAGKTEVMGTAREQMAGER